MLKDFQRSYIEAMIFANEEVEGKPISSETYKKIQEDCKKFYTENKYYINGHINDAGKDFYFTRCRHGTGFWAYPEIYGVEFAEILTNKAHSEGEFEIYLGDDGKVHHSG